MCKTNIYDLGFIYFSVVKEKLHSMNRDIDNIFAGSYMLGMIDFFLRLLYYIIKSPFNYKKSLRNDNAVLIYGESVNNRNTLLPILEELGNKKVIDLHSHRQYPKWRMYWYAISHLIQLVQEIKKATPEKRYIIKHFFTRFWMMYGCNKAAGELLDFYMPKVLVVANDHLPFHRALMHEANARNIFTIYVQHAAVTEEFPPLEFSYSLLDGEDSYNKYKKREDTKGIIYLCGGIRFDFIKNIKAKEHNGIIVGVAINLIDDEKLVKEACVQIKNFRFFDKNINVVLRPHPQMRLDMWREWCVQNGVGLSVATKETSFEFLSRISVLVSNQSSIHLDASMCHTPSVVYRLSNEELDDSYSFVKNGLTRRASTMEELASFIAESSSFKPNEDAVKYYNCSYGSSYEGNVAKMMADLIASIPDKVEQFNNMYGFREIENDKTKRVFKSE